MSGSGELTPTTASSEMYLSITEADTFFAAILGTDAWDDATESDQTKALKMATVKIDNLPLQGFKLLSTQARAFPRKYSPADSINPWGNLLSEDPWGYVYDSSEVPQFVLDACCWEALYLLKFYADDDWQERRDRQAQGVASSSDPSGSESYLQGASTARCGLLSQEAFDLLSPYIERRGNIR